MNGTVIVLMNSDLLSSLDKSVRAWKVERFPWLSSLVTANNTVWLSLMLSSLLSFVI